MTVQWEKVYVFISSTFNDMHAERDYLVKQVFPRLQEWCERHKLRLVDIDLRWGVTEADASQNKRVVQVCLERIDACRPFFICLLGQRRGWVPSRGDISGDTFSAYPDLDHYAGVSSVTELEILHAFINPLHGGKIGGDYVQSEHSFFYLRQPEYLASLPADPPQLRTIYTNESSADPARDDAELRRWREVEIPKTRRPVHAYTAHWDAMASTPEIRLTLECPSIAERGSASWKAALRRWSGQWAQVDVRVDADGRIADPIELEKAEQYNTRLTQGRLAQFTCDGQSLADAILTDLQAAIATRYPEHVETADLTPLQRELDQQAQFLAMAGEGFIERQGDFSGLDGYLQDDSDRSFFLSAPVGLGKTSLLARWIDRAQLDLQAGESLHYRFIGASDGSTTVDALLRSLLTEIKETTSKLEEEIPTESEKLRAALPALLEAIGKHGKTVLVLDGLNQLESGLGDLVWLPLTLPAGIRLIASFKRGEPDAEAYFAKLQADGQAVMAEVKPFASLEDRRRLVLVYLSQFLKELDERHLDALVRSEGADNPLYLKVVLTELRVFGVFGDLGAKIRDDFGTTPVEAFTGLLQRLESDPAYSPVRPEFLVPNLFGWLAHARTGLTVEELVALLVREGLLPDDEAGWQGASEAVLGLLRQVRPYMSRREGRIDFFYESFELAVKARFVHTGGQENFHTESCTACEWHSSLAEYFDTQPLRLGAEQTPNGRKLAELAYQLAHAGMGEPLKRTLWDFRYIVAQVEASGIESLIEDYDLANLPEAGLTAESRQTLALLQQTLRLSAHIVTRDPSQLPSQLTGRLLGSDAGEIDALLETVRRETRRAWLRPLSPSLEGPGGALVRTLSAPGGTGALTLAPDGRTAVSASLYDLTVWDLDTGRALRTMQGPHTSHTIEALALTPDGQSVVAASRMLVRMLELASGNVLSTLDSGVGRGWADTLSAGGRFAVNFHGGKISIRDVLSGQIVQTLAGHTLGAEHVAIASDGSRAISAASRGGEVKIWNVFTGAEMHNLAGHGQWHVNAVAITPDGRLAVSCAGDGAIRVWDVESGSELHALTSHSGRVLAVELTPDGRLAVSGSGDKTLKVWEVASGRELCSLTGHTAPVTAVAITPDGRYALSGCRQDDYTLKLWDIRAAIRAGASSSADAQPRGGHASEVGSVAVTPDGRWAISASSDGTLKVWDAETGAELRTLTGHAGGVCTVALTPDGRLAVSGSHDGTLKVWDVVAGAELCTLARPADQPKDDAARAVLVTPDGMHAVGALAGRLREWRLATGEELRVLDGYASGASYLAQSVDGRLVISQATGDSPLVWDMGSGRMLHRLHSAGEYRRVDAVTPDLRLAITSASLGKLGRQRTVWDVASGKEILALRGQPRSRKASTPDGRLTVQERADGTLKVLDAASGEVILTPAAYTFSPRAFTPDGRLAVSVYSRTLGVWDISASAGSGQLGWVELGTMSGHSSWINCLALTPDGRLAISASADETLKVWDVASRTALRTLTGHRDNISGVALSSDGRLAVSVSFDGVLKVWETETGKALHTLAAHPGPTNSVGIALGTYAVSASVDRTMKVWLLRSGVALRTLVGHAKGVNAVALTHTGHPAVSASDDRTLKVWDIMSGKVLRTLSGHADRVTAVALTKDGHLAVSASADQTLKVWDVDGGIELRTLTGHSGKITSLALTADGRLAVSAAMDMTLRLWDVASGREALSLSGLSDRVTAVAISADGRMLFWATMDGVIRVWGIHASSDDRQPSLVAEFTAEGDIGKRIAVTPDGRRIVAGDKAGAVHFLRIEGVSPGPAVVTAWRDATDCIAFGCPNCRTWSRVSRSALGTELPCDHCGKPIILNPFVIESDWHPVAMAWKGKH